MASDKGVRTMSNLFTLAAMLAVAAFAARGWDFSALRAGLEATPTAAGAPADTIPELGVGAASVSPDPSESEVGEIIVRRQAPELGLPPASGVREIDSSALCGDARLEGVVIGALKEVVSESDPRECGADDAIRVDKVAGVVLAPTAVTTCPVAVAFADWLEQSVAPSARARLDGEVVRIRQVSDYVCRTRNNEPGGKMSEHAFANAIDIATFVLADGSRISVVRDWAIGDDAPPAGLFLEDVWRAACGPFKTVLGPLADAAHEDHIHLDAAERRSPFCQ